MSFLELLAGPLQAAKAVLAQAGPLARSLGIPIPEGLLEAKAVEKVQSMQTSIAESGPIPAESAARNALAKVAGLAGVGAVAGVALAVVAKRRGAKAALVEGGKRAKRKISVTISGQVAKRRKKTTKTTKSKGKRKQKKIKARARAEGQAIRFTKKGQPFVIDPKSGKARFIKKSSASSSKKRKGGLK